MDIINVSGHVNIINHNKSITKGICKMIIFIFLSLSLIHGSDCSVYELNATEYYKMPPMFELDHYSPCVNQPGGVYCSVEVNLVSDTHSELLTMIRNYSSYREFHFNHSKVSRGVCVTKTCKEYLSNNVSVELRSVIEECLNDSLWKDYKLKGRLTDTIYCNDMDKNIAIDYGDVIMGVVCLAIVIMNVVGSVYDFFFLSDEDKNGNNILLCFSVRHNWRRLVAPSADGGDPHLKRFKGFNGLRALTMILVILVHSFLPVVVSSENPHDLESNYHNVSLHVFIDGVNVVHTFFIMSGCLMAYTMERIAEMKRVTWKMLPLRIVVRYLRLTPSYAVVLLATTTWLRFAGSGPLWQSNMMIEVEACRKYGWLHLFYLNNYVDYSQCMVQTWYLAADMQLFIVGLCIFVFAQSKTSKKVTLGVLFVISLVIPACHTYFQNLNATLIANPEISRNYFVTDPTFNNAHKRGHTNMATYLMGIALGLLIYHLQRKDDFSIDKYKKYRYVYWGALPMMLAILSSGSAFYMGGVQPPLILKAIYSSVAKPLFALTIITIVLGMVFKLESVYRGVLEWNGWAAPGRVSYSAYLLHMMFIRGLTGSRTTLMHNSLANMFLFSCGMMFITFLAAYPFWMFVEAPSINLSKLLVPIKNIQDNATPEPDRGNGTLKEKLF